MPFARQSIVALVAVAAVLAAVLAYALTARADTSVSITGFAFSPGNVTVSVGDTVTWTHNDGDIPHTVTSTGGGPLSSGNMTGGDTYAFTFEEAGTYQYFCAVHPDMTGSVNVEAANGNGDAPANDQDTPEPEPTPEPDEQETPDANGNGEVATPAPPDTGDDDNGGNTGLIAGAIVVVVIVALAGGFLALRRRQAP